MGLRSGLTAFFKEEFEAFVFLDGFPEAPRTPRTSKAPLTPLGVEGRWQWSPLVAIPATCCRADLTALPGSSVCFFTSVVFLRVHEVGSLNDHPTRMGDRNKQSHKDWRRVSLRDPVVFFFRYPFRRGYTKRTPCVRRVRRQRDGGSFPQDGLLLFFLFQGPEAFA